MRHLPLILSLCVLPAWAADVPPPPALEPVPDGAPGPEDAPPVTIQSSGQGQVEEYRVRGKLYMLKVTPRNGPPYYLIDPNGDGRFQRQDSMPGVNPPMWTVKEF